MIKGLSRFAALMGLAAVVSVSAGNTAAWADDDAQPEKKPQVSGRIVIQGPDGKRQQFDFGDKLSKEMQERMEQHMKAAGKNVPKIETRVRGKAIIIGPDGKQREIQLGGKDGKCPGAGCQLQVIGTGGKVVIVGPDGKKREFSLGGTDAKEVEVKEDDEDAEVEESPSKGGASRPRAMRMGKVVIVGPDGKPREFNLGDMPKIDLGGLLPKDLDLPEEIEKTIRAHLQRADALPRAGGKAIELRRGQDMQLKRMQRQMEQLQKQVDELKKQLDELKQ